MDNIISMHNDLPRTPQTLPCGGEDPFFIFHEDDSINDSVGVEIGGSNTTSTANRNCDQEALSSYSHFLPTSRQTNERDRYSNIVGKELNFEPPASKTTVEKQQKYNAEDSIRSSSTLPVHISMKKKRSFYRSKSLSASKLSNMIKTVIQSPSKKLESRDNKNKIYSSLEEDDDEEDPMMYPNNDCDDDRSSCHRLPVRLMTSLHRNKKYASSSSSSITSSLSLPRKSKKKWNRLLQMDSLATFKVPESSPSSITISSASAANTEKTSSKAMVGEELSLSSSFSTASSIASWNSCPTLIRSVDSGETNYNNRRFTTQSHRLTSMLQKGLYSSRVDEEEDEDTDIEEDDTPVAGSFAYAIGRRVG